MKRLKKYVLCLMCLCCLGILTGCGNNAQNDNTVTDEAGRADKNDGIVNSATDQSGLSGDESDAVEEDGTNGSADTEKGRMDGADDAGENLVDGVGDAGRDLVDGAGDAGEALIDGAEDLGEGVIDGAEDIGDALTGNETDGELGG